jgi:hypothetical protein
MRMSGLLGCVVLAAPLIVSCVSNETEKVDGAKSEGSPEESPAPVGQTEESSESYIVSEDIYNETFSEIENLISKLDAAIREKNYEEWLRNLSEEYISFTSRPDFLQSASQSPLLQKSNITLKTLRDYFLSVVVPSHAQATLTRLDFMDGTHVKAITIIRGEPVILYLLVKVAGRWVVGIW